METITTDTAPVNLPRVTIHFCTQCRWLLRGAWYAQELLSTFSTAIGEVALIPATGGVFTIDIVHAGPRSKIEREAGVSSTTLRGQPTTTRLWDRKTESGFPETKELKRRVRDIIEPGRDLGHVDGNKRKGDLPIKQHSAVEPDVVDADENKPTESSPEAKRNADGSICEDCI